MHRIDADAHASNLFADGDDVTGTPGTKLSAAWLNAVQEEICNLLVGMGVALSKADNTQLLAAAVAAATANKIVRRDDAGRAQFADPAAAADADTKGARDAADAVVLAAAQVAAQAYATASEAAAKSYADGLAGRVVAAARVQGTVPGFEPGAFGFSSVVRIGGEAAGGYSLTPNVTLRNPIVLASLEFGGSIRAQHQVAGNILVRTYDSAGVQTDIAWFNLAVAQGAA